jgi:integrase
MEQVHFDDLPPIPVVVQTRDGQMVDTQAAIWYVRTYAERGTLVAINWRLFDEIVLHGQPVFSPRAIHLLKLYLAHRLQTRSPATARKDVNRLRTFGRWLASEPSLFHARASTAFSWAQLDAETARAYCEWCLSNRAGADSVFASLRALYRWGVGRSLPDFSLQTLKAIKAIVIPNAAKGHHVRFRHVIHGPFSPEELTLIRRELDWERGGAEDRAIIMLHLELGANPSAFCRLVNGDLKRIEADGRRWYQLAVPRLKKRRGERETKRRPISQRLGKLLTSLQRGGPESRMLHWLSPDHPTDGVRWAMHRWVEAVNLISPRTGELLHMRPRRFRYSYATHIAEAGASKYHLAELLDHTDLQSVDVYVETSPAIAEQVARATDDAMRPLIRRFLGKIICGRETDEVATQPTIPASVPHLGLPLLNAGGVGVCGRQMRGHDLCQLFPPLSCYLCPSFAAWREGAHQEILRAIEQFVERQHENTDGRILQQLQEVRLAVAEVIARCQDQDN